MTMASIETIVQAQRLVMAQHDTTSETALGLLVFSATERGVTVLEVAESICRTSAWSTDVDGPVLHATA